LGNWVPDKGFPGSALPPSPTGYGGQAATRIPLETDFFRQVFFSKWQCHIARVVTEGFWMVGVEKKGLGRRGLGIGKLGPR
jgi:hypothetical protein